MVKSLPVSSVLVQAELLLDLTTAKVWEQFESEARAQYRVFLCVCVLSSGACPGARIIIICDHLKIITQEKRVRCRKAT